MAIKQKEYTVKEWEKVEFDMYLQGYYDVQSKSKDK